MIRFLPGSIELVLHRRVAVLATSSDAAARQAVRAQLQEAVTAAENLARQAEAGEAPDGTGSPLRIVRQPGRGSVSRGRVSISVTFDGLRLGRFVGDQSQAAQVTAQACAQAASTARALLLQLE